MSRSRQFSPLSFYHPIFFPLLSTHPLSHLLFHPSALFSLLMSFPLLSSVTLILIFTFHPLLCASFVCFFFSLPLILLHSFFYFVSTLSSLSSLFPSSSFSSIRSLCVCPSYLFPSLLSLSPPPPTSFLHLDPLHFLVVSLTPAPSLPF